MEPKPISLLTGKAITHLDYHLNEPASPYTNWEKTDNCFVSSVIIDKYFLTVFLVRYGTGPLTYIHRYTIVHLRLGSSS